MTTLMPLDSGSGSSAQEAVVESTAQVGRVMEIIESVSDSISHDNTWNRHQCKHIADRFTAIGERFKSTHWGRDYKFLDELITLLRKGANLLRGCKASKDCIVNVVSRGDNREAFEEVVEELDTLEAKGGLQVLGAESTEFMSTTPGVMESGLKLQDAADEDKKEISGICKSQIKTSTPSAHVEKLSHVVSDRMKAHVDVKALLETGEPLPSYLSIDIKSDIVKGELIRPYERQSERDPPEQVGWAAVHSGTWLGYGFAIKVFNCRAKDGRAFAWNAKQLLMEAGSLLKLQHPHVVRVVGFGQNEEESIFVMELMDGDLGHYMRKNSEFKPFTASVELDIIHQIAKGMYFMHMKGYAHGDLKCSNIVYKKYADQYLEVKLSDLRGSQKSPEKAWDPEAFAHASKTRRPRWTAPEAIHHYKGKKPSWESLIQSDVYSFGMTCYEIVTRKYPFDGVRDENLLLERIQERGGPAKWNQLPAELDKALKGLIQSCWNEEGKRPTFGVICHRLDDIRFKKSVPAACGAMVAAMWSQVKQIPAVVGTHICPSWVLGYKPSAVEPVPYDSELIYLSMISPNQLKRLERIGQGSTCQVYKATWLNCTFAVKILKSEYSTNLDFLKMEVDLLVKLSRHPCITRLVGLSWNSIGEYSLVMEYMDGNLGQLIETRMKKPGATKPFTGDEEGRIITTIAWGMAYLHYMGLVHRDLHPGNVLAQDYSQTVNVKIVDFDKSHLEACSEPSNSSQTPRYYEGVGYYCFRAPEMLSFSDIKTCGSDSELRTEETLPDELRLELPDASVKPDLEALKATDVYSFAMVCYEVLTGHCPCRGLDRTKYAIMARHRPKWPALDAKLNNERDADLKSLIERCWKMAPTDRPTFREICEDLQNIFRSNL